MKIKLKEYSLVSNLRIKELIKSLEFFRSHTRSYEEEHELNIKISLLEETIGDLIPCERLAKKCFNKGWECGIEEKNTFLESEIEI